MEKTLQADDWILTEGRVLVGAYCGKRYSRAIGLKFATHCIAIHYAGISYPTFVAIAAGNLTMHCHFVTDYRPLCWVVALAVTVGAFQTITVLLESKHRSKGATAITHG